MKHYLRRPLIVLCLALATSGTAFARELSDLRTGTRVRATYLAEQDQGKTRSRQITGTLEEITDCTLGVSELPNRPLLYLPLTSITRLERSIRPSRRDEAMRAGFFVGLGIGTAIALPLALDKPKTGEWDLRGLAILVEGFFILAGSAVGSLIALGMPGEKWQDVDLSRITINFESDSGHEGRLLLGFRF